MFVQEHQMATVSTDLRPRHSRQVAQGSAISFLVPDNHRSHPQRFMDKTIHEGPNNRLPSEYNLIDKLSGMQNGGGRKERAGNAAEKFAADRLNQMVVAARKGPSSSTSNIQLDALTELEKRGGKTAPDSSIKLTGHGLAGGGKGKKIAKLFEKMHIGGPSERTKYYSYDGRYKEWSPSPSPPRRRSPPPGYEFPPPDLPPDWSPPRRVAPKTPEPSPPSSPERPLSPPAESSSPTNYYSNYSSLSTDYYTPSTHSSQSGPSSENSIPPLEPVSSPEPSPPRASSFEEAYPQNSQYGSWW